eukprot:2756061-Pyramimonas_sp.AAC.1
MARGFVQGDGSVYRPNVVRVGSEDANVSVVWRVAAHSHTLDKPRRQTTVTTVHSLREWTTPLEADPLYEVCWWVGKGLELFGGVEWTLAVIGTGGPVKSVELGQKVRELMGMHPEEVRRWIAQQHATVIAFARHIHEATAALAGHLDNLKANRSLMEEAEERRAMAEKETQMAELANVHDQRDKAVVDLGRLMM